MTTQQNTASFLRLTLIVSLAGLLSKVLGLVRQQYSLYLFGGGWEFDAFIAAARIPNALRELLAEGALSAAFLPIFSELLHGLSRARAFAFAQQLLLLAVALTLGTVALSMTCSEYFMPLYHYNPGVPQATILAERLFDIIMLYLPFISLSALVMGVLNSLGRFAVSALGPCFSNVAFLVFVYCTKESLGIESLAYGTIVGSMTYFLIQVPVLLQCRFPWRIEWSGWSGDIKKFLVLFVPFALSMGIPKLNHILSNLFSDEITGANTALAQSFFVVQLPVSLFVVSISTVSVPNMLKSFLKNDMGAFQEVLLTGLKLALIFSVPSAVGLMLLDAQIVRLVFNDSLALVLHTQSDVIGQYVLDGIAEAQFYFAPGIIAMSVSIILVRAFQSMRDVKYLMWSSVLGVALHFVCMSVFIVYLEGSFDTIALSITLAACVSAGFLLRIFHIKVSGFPWMHLLVTVYKVLAASLCMGLCVWLLEDFALYFERTPLYSVLTSCSLIVMGIVVYGVSLYVLKEQEWRSLIHALRRRSVRK